MAELPPEAAAAGLPDHERDAMVEAWGMLSDEWRTLREMRRAAGIRTMEYATERALRRLKRAGLCSLRRRHGREEWARGRREDAADAPARPPRDEVGSDDGAWLERLLPLAVEWENELASEKEREFVAAIHARWTRYGEKLWLSPGQRDWLRDIERRLRERGCE